MHGFGRVSVEADEPVFHHAWEGRVFGMAMLLVGSGLANPDAFRHAIESVAPADYLTRGYYGRWLLAIQRLLIHAGVLGADEILARDPAGGPPLSGEITVPLAPRPAVPNPTTLRSIDTAPRFAVGQAVVARDAHPAGHTRLPRYVRGKAGVVARVHPAWVFPDTNAHGLGEQPQHVYAVRFTGAALWGADAEPGTAVHVDLFERYLDPA
jgi:nitrile hydratase